MSPTDRTSAREDDRDNWPPDDPEVWRDIKRREKNGIHCRDLQIGYARVSTGDQNTDAQEVALGDAGCVRVFTDRASGAKADRPQLTAALDYLNSGDTLVVWRLDRLGRSLTHLVDVVHQLGDRGIEFRSLTEAIDTTTPSGRLLFHVAAAFAEFERDLIRERTRAGLAAARDAGRFGGRPTVMTRDRLTAARALVDAGKTHAEIAGALGVSLSSLRRALRGENKIHRPLEAGDASREGGATVTQMPPTGAEDWFSTEPQLHDWNGPS